MRVPIPVLDAQPFRVSVSYRRIAAQGAGLFCCCGLWTLVLDRETKGNYCRRVGEVADRNVNTGWHAAPGAAAETAKKRDQESLSHLTCTHEKWVRSTSTTSPPPPRRTRPKGDTDGDNNLAAAPPHPNPLRLAAARVARRQSRTAARTAAGRSPHEEAQRRDTGGPLGGGKTAANAAAPGTTETDPHPLAADLASPSAVELAATATGGGKGRRHGSTRKATAGVAAACPGVGGRGPVPKRLDPASLAQIWPGCCRSSGNGCGVEAGDMAGVAVAVADSDSDWAAPVVVAAIDDSGRSCVEVTAAAAVEAMAAAAGEAAPVVVADGNDDSGRICGKGGYRSLRWQMRRQGRRRADDRRRE
ncbi:hypothetical protein OsI_29744 [Oryza sativa Indica Group]|uniref:Uncharacterized protein n=2 Tax=Oryza sativa TaxID=4530 RepID=B9G1L7_ORYSJ|nr:hypothetical protein OsI_29744 [Oryza sativa Indica Group]EEE68934.1 hypothetical protein OsJ_27808 [Oryza sativa Japonica Group]